MEKLAPRTAKKESLSKEKEIAPTHENETLVLLDRLNNPVIRERLIDDLYLHQSTMDTESYKKSLANGGVITKGLNEVLKLIKRRQPISVAPTVVSRDVISKKLDAAISEVFNRTDVTFHKTEQAAISPGFGHPGIVAPYAINPQTQERFSVHALSMAEAHEKGHGIRRFPGESDFTRKLAAAFDFGAVSQEDIDEYKKFANAAGNKEYDVSDAESLNYFKNPIELVERMSQLKNYFGMKGDEIFTKEHLAYAREHYLEHYQFPVQMRIFLSAITPQTEDKFIELMNTLGV